MPLIATTHINHGGGDTVSHFHEGDVIPEGMLSETDVEGLMSVGAVVEVTEKAIEPTADAPKDTKATAADKSAEAAKS